LHILASTGCHSAGYFSDRIRRRTKPAKLSRPVPKRASIRGSGTGRCVNPALVNGVKKALGKPFNSKLILLPALLIRFS